MGFSVQVKKLSKLCLAGFIALGLAACGSFGGATPTATVPPPTATVAPSATATSAPTSAPTNAPTVAATTVASNAPSPSPTAPQATATAAPPTTAPPTATTPPPTATVAPSATATTAPTATSTAVLVLPTLAPTATLPPPPPSAPGSTVNDPQGRCALTLPAGFAASGTGGIFTGAGGRATIALAGLVAEPGDTLDDVALPFISTATAGIADYQQLRAIKGADSLRIDYTGRMAQPGTGTFFLRQFGGTVCALSFFVVQGTELSYEATLAQLLASLRVVGAVGVRPR